MKQIIKKQPYKKLKSGLRAQCSHQYLKNITGQHVQEKFIVVDFF